ncbi:MAG: hypothetical protein AAFZ07_06780 [Actinomycetota bacterium]
MRVIRARRGSDRANQRLATAAAEHRTDTEPASSSRALSATDRD